MVMDNVGDGQTTGRDEPVVMKKTNLFIYVKSTISFIKSYLVKHYLAEINGCLFTLWRSDIVNIIRYELLIWEIVQTTSRPTPLAPPAVKYLAQTHLYHTLRSVLLSLF